jgi:hypothetical protein
MWNENARSILSGPPGARFRYGEISMLFDQNGQSENAAVAARFALRRKSPRKRCRVLPIWCRILA